MNLYGKCRGGFKKLSRILRDTNLTDTLKNSGNFIETFEECKKLSRNFGVPESLIETLKNEEILLKHCRKQEVL